MGHHVCVHATSTLALWQSFYLFIISKCTHAYPGLMRVGNAATEQAEHNPSSKESRGGTACHETWP